VRTLYVAPTGSDSNPGTDLEPFATIQHAAAVVNPGDTVIVQDGVYQGVGAGTPCASNKSRPVVCLTRGGTASAWVTFRAAHRGGAHIDGDANTSTDGFQFLSSANYITIEGFDVHGMGNDAGSSSGFELYNGGHDVVIVHNEIHDIGRLCTDTSNGEVGVFIQQPRVHVEANYIHDIGRFASGENGCAPGNAYYKNHDHGIYVNGTSESFGIPGANDAWIGDNIFFNQLRGWSIQVYPDLVTGLSILNNTFAFPNPYQSGHILMGADTLDARIINNIFYRPNGVAIYYGLEVNLQVTKNLVYGATLLNTTPVGAVVVANQVADPLLIDTASPPYDFHLGPGSPAINAGLSLLDVLLDFDGAVRSDETDIGAYEFGALATTDTAATPTITPNGGQRTGSVLVTLSTTTTGATIRYTTDGSTPDPLSPTYTLPFELMVSATVKAQAIATGMADSAVAEATFQIESDVDAPTVAITSPVDGASVSRWIRITAVADDNVGVASVQFFADGTAVTTDTTAPYTASWRTRISGPHVLTAVATDAAGNTATSSITVWR
jgi:hypothetical protein